MGCVPFLPVLIILWVSEKSQQLSMFAENMNFHIRFKQLNGIEAERCNERKVCNFPEGCL